MLTDPSKLRPDPDQPRKTFDEAGLRELGESMRIRQLQPILARPDGTIISGERRWRAAMLVGLPEVDVTVIEGDLSVTSVRIMQLEENLQRSDLTDAEAYQSCKELAALNPGWKRKDLAAHLHKDASWVTRIMSPDDCLPEVREAFLAGRLTLSHVYAISRSRDQQSALAAALGGASRDELERQVRQQRNGGSAVRAAKIRCPLPSGCTITVTGQDVSLDDVIEAMKDALKAMQKARDTGLDVKTAERVWKDVAKAG